MASEARADRLRQPGYRREGIDSRVGLRQKRGVGRIGMELPPQHLPERVAVGRDEDQSADGMAPACKICIKTY
mgnify:CR=1 FL=1